MCSLFFVFFFFKEEDGIRYLVRSRGLGDVYKRQIEHAVPTFAGADLGKLEDPGRQDGVVVPILDDVALSLIHI